MSPSWRFMQIDTTSSLVGVSVVNRQVVWASGSLDVIVDEPSSPGVVLRTVDGGESWQDVTPPGGEELDFQDIEAFDRNHALALAVGVGEASKIYRTADGGTTWELAFQNEEPEAFYDGIAFFDHRRGLALSDPVQGKFVILATVDGGHTWQVAAGTGMPPAMSDEAARATGTCLVARGPDDAWFGTWPQGPSRVFHTRDGGDTWSTAITPIPGQIPGVDLRRGPFGIASLAFRDAQHGVALGGSDPFTDAPSVVAVTADGGTTWSPVGSPAGFRFNMASVPTNAGDTLVAVGRSGSDFSTDGGHTWHLLDGIDLRGVNSKPHVACWAVGKNGTAAKLIL